MYLHKWNEALVDWVNCLGLVDRIKDLTELEDGHFFRLLLKNLALPNRFPDSDLSPDEFAVVYTNLEKEFPYYGVCEIEREVDTKLSYISSLLLLLSVTKGKTPMFRSHLCEDLQHDSQVKIKCFLESCLERADRLDHKHLKSIIEGEFVPSETSGQCRQSKELGLPKTPLKVFFDSPRQTDKLTRDLRRLEAENEALQIEKMELEDELRIEKEKREQIEGNLLMKNEQVVKLREELQEFAQSMETHEKAEGVGPYYHTIQSLKSEVKELERYINALTEEKSAINDEKIKLQEKLLVFQSKIKELETRALHSESKNEELQMILNKNNQEFHALKEHCIELEEKICAFPLQHNTSIETDTSLSFVGTVSSPFSEGERMSHAVVDIKLAEVEEENEKLKDQIKGIMDQRENLTDQLREVKDKLENARVAQKAAAAENVKIQDKLIEYTNEREQLNIALSEAMLKISKQQDLITFTNKEATDLSRKLNVAVELNSHLEFESNSLKEDVREKQARLDEMNIQLDLITSEKTLYEKQLLGAGDKVKNMEIQLNDFGVTIKDLTEKLTDKNYLIEKTSQALKDCEENLEMMKKEKESAVKNIDMKEEELKKLKDNINEEEDIIRSLKSDHETLIVKQSQEKQKLEAYIESIKSDMKQLEEEKLNYIQEKTVYERKLLDAGDKINIMETKLIELVKMTEKSTEQLAEKVCIIEKTSQALKDCEENLEMMKKEKESAVENIEMKEEELKKLKDQINEEQDIIQSLRSNQEVILVKQSQEKQKLEAYIESIKSDMKQLEEEKLNYIQEKTVYERKLLDAGDKINIMETKLIELVKMTEKLTEQLAEKVCIIEKTSQALKDCEENLEMLTKEKESAVENIEMKEEELKKLKDQINEEQDIIQSLKSNQEVILVKQSQEKQKLEAYIESIKSDRKQLDEEKLNYIQEKTVYERKLLDAGDKINIMETKLIELVKMTEKLTEQLAEKVCIIEKTSQALKDCEENLEMMKKEKESAVDNIAMKEEEIKKLKDQINEEQDIIRSLKSDHESLIVRQSQEKQKLESYIKSLISDVNQSEEGRQNYIQMKTIYESNLLDAEDNVKKMETKLIELGKMTKNVTEQLSEKNCLIEKTSQALKDCEENLEMIKKEKDSAVENIAMKEEELKKLKDQITEEQDIIRSLKSNQEIIIVKQIQEKQKLESFIESLKSDVIQLEEEKLNYIQEKTVYERKLLDTGYQVNIMKTKLIGLEKKTEQLAEQLTEKECLVEKTSQAINASEESLEMLKKEKGSAVENIEMKEEELKKLKDQITKEQDIIRSLKSNQEVIIVKQIQEKQKLESFIESLKSDVIQLEEEKLNYIQEKTVYERKLLDTGYQVNIMKTKLIGLEKKTEQLAEQLTEKECLVEKTSQAINASEESLEMLKKEKDSAVENIEMKEEELKKLKDQITKEQDIIRSLKSNQEVIIVKQIQEKQKLESFIESLKSDVKQLEEEKQNYIQEKTVYERKLLDASDKVNNLEMKLIEHERKIEQLTEEINEKNFLVDKTLKEIDASENQLELMKSKENLAVENIVAKEQEFKKLEDQLNKEKIFICSLKSDREALLAEKKQVLAMLDELRTTIDMLQQQQNTYNEERLSMEFELSHWKSEVKNVEKKMEELKVQNCFTCSEKIMRSQSDAELHGKYLEKSHIVETNDLSPGLGRICSTYADHLNDGSLQFISIEEKCEHSDKKFPKLPPVNVGNFKQQLIKGERFTQLDVEKKLWELVSSWHELEIVLEKLQEMRNQLNVEISCLWETIPRTQLKCNDLFLSKGSAQILGKEAEQSKEVARRLESMIRSLEKYHSSLERELMHAFFTTVSWGLSGIQGQFGAVSNDGIHSDITQLTDVNADLCQLQDQRNEIYGLLDALRDKLRQALEDVHSTKDIFCEVERRCESASDALEYLKRNCLFEEEMLNGIKSEKTSKKDGETLKKALDEMEIAKRDLERISKETQQELEKSQREKEILVQKMDFLNTLNIKLENKLELSEEKVERVKQETLEKVQKIFEEKLVKAKEKLKSHYMEDVMKFNEEIQLCKQFEEGYKKYRSLAVDCEKRLSDATAQINDLLNKVEILKKQKSLLEEKLRLSKLELGRGDAQRESMNPDIYKSHSVEHIANYFAEGKLADPSHMKFQSERSLNPVNISSSFSRESVHSNLPSGMGQVFCAEDEEGELFNATYLADLKEGKCNLPSNVTNKKRETLGVLNDNIKQNHDKASGFFVDSETPNKRFTELMRRNTLCLPHLKSSYPAETQFHDPKNFSEDFLKGNFSLKAPLLGENQSRRLSDIRRRKDIGQTTYMKPGPPTPGKNRRASLQGAEQGIDQGKIQSTPGRFRSWFGRGKRSVPISDAENIPVTPRTKQKGLLRRALANLERDGS